jgi:hypothetical protein
MKNKLFAVILCVAVAFGEEKSGLPLPASRNVTLTLAEYDRLVDLARKQAKLREMPPLPYALKRAELKLRVGNTSVMGSVLLEGEVFSRNATKVPLTSGMTILNAHQDGRDVPLEQEGANAVAILPGQSDFALTLDTGLPLQIEAGRASFTLPVPSAGSVKLSMTIPGDHSLVGISSGLITSRTSENGQTRIEATLAPGQPADIWWATGAVTAPVAPREVRFLSDIKTLVTVSESDMRIAALADITVVQGEPAQFAIEIPAGYEITGATGAAVEASEIQSGVLLLRLNNGKARSYQFLISMERPLSDTKAETPFLSFKDTQRETGELLVEGAGAMELTATEAGGLKRMDLKEVNPYLRSLSRFPLQAAFRYHRQPNETPALALAWTRFPESTVLSAAAEYAVVTTLVTSEGRSLTEIKLIVKNHAQPFLKVALPGGASILSAEVAGEKVKPVLGTDGTRVPLLRAGFRPNGAYEVSFVFMHSGTPFAKKGGSDLSLPSMDVPINVLQWEIFLPDQYKVKDFSGDTIAINLLPVPIVDTSGDRVVGTLANLTQPFDNLKENESLDKVALFVPGVTNGAAMGGPASVNGRAYGTRPGQLGGTITDPQGAVISGAQVKVTSVNTGMTRATTTNYSGQWTISGMPAGPVKVEAAAPGFNTTVANAALDIGSGSGIDLRLNVGATTQTVEVTASAPMVDTSQSQVSSTFSTDEPRASGYDKHTRKRDEKKQEAQLQNQASANVFNLQKRVAGVLPVRVDVPRAGTSYRFARALVVDEETKVSFNYKSK